MSAAAQALEQAKPYKGPDSYQIEDGKLYFGRSRDCDRLIAKILSARATLLHAQSGAGKTSLLNARVIPGLEIRGWTAVRILPQNDLVESIRDTTLRHVLPPPEAEFHALRRAVDMLSFGDSPDLRTILKRFDDLKASDPKRGKLLSLIDLPVRGEAGDARPARALLLRLLRSTLGTAKYSEHLGALLAAADDAFPPDVNDSTSASDLLRELSDPALAAGHAALTKDISAETTLKPFFSALLDRYGGNCKQFGLVLVLDQFEELFTRFVQTQEGTGSAAEPTWKKRWQFIEQLEQLYASCRSDWTAGGEGSTIPALPIRFVISMRDEYIAQLDPVRRILGDLDASTFHLNLLEIPDAREAIREPAIQFGYQYSAGSFDDIVQTLTREDRFIEPGPLQIVCEKLWNTQGQRLASAAIGGEAEVLDLPKGGTKAILDSFFTEFLESLGPDSDQALEILEPLVTESRTRNILEYRRLVNAPFRDVALRERVVEKMLSRSIVRRERRLGGQFVEITHEFLIPSILERIAERNRNPGYSRLRGALETLQRFKDVDRFGVQNVLYRDVFRVLDEVRDQISWTDWAIELMFRSALVLGEPRGRLKYWADRYKELSSALDPETLVNEDAIRSGAGYLSLDEFECVNRVRESLTLSATQAGFVLRSLLSGSLSGRSDIVYWTKRLNECSEAPYS